MACNCNQLNGLSENTNQLPVEQQVFNECVRATFNLVNYNAKDENGKYVCRDSNNPCYTVEDIQHVIYVYIFLVKNGEIPVYDPDDDNADTPLVVKKVSTAINMAEGRVGAILWWLFQGVKNGTIKNSDCLNPVKNKAMTWILISAAALAIIGGVVLIKKSKAGKNLKNKLKRGK